MKRLFIISVICSLTLSVCYAQRDFRKEFEERTSRQRERFDSITYDQQKQFDEFRRKQNESYVGRLRQRWEQYETAQPLTPEEENRIVPMEYAEPPISVSLTTKSVEFMSAEEQDSLALAAEERHLPTHEEVIVIPGSIPQPQPMVPIKASVQEQDIVSIALYGTFISVPFPKNVALHLQSLDENGIATLWEQIADTVVPSQFDITILSCLKHRDDMKLCDWAYLKMVQTIAKKRFGNTNEATIFAAYIMAQSGYKIRLAFTESYAYILLASHHEIYGMNRYHLDNEWYYMVDSQGVNTCYISNVGYDKEQKLSLFIPYEQKIDFELSDTIIATSRKGWSLPIQTNINLINFYNDYPTGRVFHGDESSKWLIGVNTPLDSVVKSILYPQIRKSIKGLTPWQATTMILNWVQTAFQYDLDENVWGRDRIFFAAETLHYPFSDCEDRAILFTTIVRDILGLDIILLYYDNPCHLATAVHFPIEEAESEFVMYNNKRYVVCDPTYTNAPIGKKMSYFDTIQAQIIIIN